MAGYLSFDIGVALLSTYDDDKFLGIQVDAFGEEQSGVVPYEAHSPHGIISRPHDPTEDGACQVLYAMEAGRGHAWVQSDPRVIPLLPPIKKGGFAFYGGNIKGPAFTNIDGETNSMTTYVPYRFDASGTPQKAMLFDINVNIEGNEAISLIHGSGAALTFVEQAGSVSAVLKNAKGDAYVEVNDDGIILNGNVTVQGGFNSGGPESAMEVALADPLIGVLTQLINIVAAINASTTGAPAAALTSQLAAIKALNSKAR